MWQHARISRIVFARKAFSKSQESDLVVQRPKRVHHAGLADDCSLDSGPSDQRNANSEALLKESFIGRCYALLLSGSAGRDLPAHSFTEIQRDGSRSALLTWCEMMDEYVRILVLRTNLTSFLSPYADTVSDVRYCSLCASIGMALFTCALNARSFRTCTFRVSKARRISLLESGRGDTDAYR